MTSNTALSSFKATRSSTPNWAERHGAWILSLCLHIALFCWLIVQTQTPFPSKPPPLRIQLILLPAGVERPVPDTPPESPPDPALSSPVSPVPVVEIPSQDLPAAPIAIWQEYREIFLPEPPLRESPNQLSSEEEQRIQELMERLAERGDHIEKSVDTARLRVDKRLQKAELLDAAQPYFNQDAGGPSGTVRSIRFGEVEPEIESAVQAEYGIRISTRRDRPSSSQGFLSRAAIGGDVFYPPDSSSSEMGNYLVIAISSRGQEKMAWLEQNWLVSHGYLPRSTRVERVEFGIGLTAAGKWDLVIKDIKVQPIRDWTRPEETNKK